MTTRASGVPAASVSGGGARRGWISAGLLVLLLTATVAARLTGHYADLSPATTATDPITSSQTWLATHNYRLVVELQGADTRNITVVRRGDVVRGEVQRTDAGQQTGYYRFRIHAGEVKTTTTGELAAAHWTPATAAQVTLLNHVTDPRWILAPLQSPAGLRDLGQSGDAEMYLSRSRDWLFTIDAQPLQVVSHNAKAGWTRTFRIQPSGVSVKD